MLRKVSREMKTSWDVIQTVYASFGLFWAHLVARSLLEMPAGIGAFILV